MIYDTTKLYTKWNVFTLKTFLLCKDDAVLRRLEPEVSYFEFTFNLPSHNHIHIGKYLLSTGDKY